MPAPAAKDKGDTGLLIALGGPKKPMPGMAGEMMEEDSAGKPAMEEIKAMAAEDAMAAVGSGDTEAFQDAMTRFVKACMSSKDY